MATESFRSDTIAVIGMACRFPSSDDPERFWRNVRDGVDSVRRWRGRTSASPNGGGVASPTFARAVLDGVETFDSRFFHFTPREAELSDPQLRVALECAWQAIEHAGIDAERFPGLIGVYMGASSSSYLYRNLMPDTGLIRRVGGTQILIRNDKDFIPTTISHRLNLKGPSVNVSTACSTSLVAVHLACQELASFQCDLALAGGVSIHLPQEGDFEFEPGGIYSSDGYCRAFDVAASGTVGGSGAGLVLLKRAEEAWRDGDFIHALILGTAVNNDGGEKMGFTAPSVNGQAEVIRQALANAGIAGIDIDLVEGHGTGTPLGDSAEIVALSRALGRDPSRHAACALGSVKTNIGHLDAAAGVAGLMKASLALRERVIPPSLHFNAPNPELRASPFYVPTSAVPWPVPERGARRHAGVSAFGVGGTNAHVILEEPPPRRSPAPARPWSVVPLSARTPGSFKAVQNGLAAHLRRQPELSLPDVAFTLAVGRKSFEQRRACVCRDTEELCRALELVPLGNPASVAPRTQPLYVFPQLRQPALEVPRAAMRHEPVFREHWTACCEALADVAGRQATESVQALLEDAARSAEAPPPAAAFALGYALGRLWMSWGVVPGGFAGAGTGAYLAGCFAGVLSLRDALALMLGHARARDVQLSPPSLPLFELTPSGVVEALGVTDARRWEELDRTRFSGVRSRSSDSQQVEACLLEFGDGVTKERAESRRFAAWPSALDGDGLRALYAALAELWSAGIDVRWDAFHAHERRAAVPLPAYPFERRRHWVDAVPRGPAESTSPSELRALGDWVSWLPPADDTSHALEAYPGVEMELDRLCLAHLRDYLAASGVPLRAGRHRRRELALRLGLHPAFARFLDFIARVLVEEDLAVATLDEIRFLDGWEAVPATRELSARLVHGYPSFEGLVTLIAHCASGYSTVLGDPRAASSRLYQDGRGELLAAAFGTETHDRSHRSRCMRALTKFLTSRARSGKVRILEVGAGSGLFTWRLQDALRGLDYRYDFTDVARGFLLAAEERAKAAGLDAVRVRRFDLDRSPEEQGLALGTYDAIVGLDGVHVARNIDTTLSHLKSLLAPGGTLCLIEAVEAYRHSHMIWGLAEGWWRFDDIAREHSPLLDRAAWERALRRAGFADVLVLPEAGKADFGLLLAQQPKLCGGSVDAIPEKNSERANWFYVPVWKRALKAVSAEPEPLSRKVWLLLAPEGHFGARMAELLRGRGHRVVVVTPGTALRGGDDEWQLPPRERAGYDTLFAGLRAEQALPERILHLFSLSWDDPAAPIRERLDAAQDLGLHALLSLAQALGRANATHPIRLTSVYNQVHDVAGGEPLRSEKGALTGALKLIPHEYANITCLGLDVALPAEGSAAERCLLERIVEEADAAVVEPFAAYRGGNRWTPSWEPIHLPRSSSRSLRLRDAGVYLISGGLGGVGLELARNLAAAVDARLVLVGRSRFPARELWATLAHGTSREAGVARALLELEEAGAQVMVASADVADAGQMARVVAEAEAHFGSAITGVIHSAAVIDAYGAIQNRTHETMELAMSAKVRGALVLDEVLRGRELEFFVMCSALGAVLHQLKFGEVGYVAANDFLDNFAYERSTREAGLTVAIGWTDWLEIGMAAQAMSDYMRKHAVVSAGQHALLGTAAASGADTVFSSTLDPATCWVLDGHRIDGTPVLPGTAYLELAFSAFVARTGTESVEMREVCLAAPMRVADGAPRQVRTRLSPAADGYTFRVESRDAGAGGEWEWHASGELCPLRADSERIDIEALRASKPVVAFDLTETTPADLGDGMRFGARWRAIRQVRFGENWGIAEIELLPEHLADLDSYRLHPALLDCALAFLCPYLLREERGTFLPFYYRAIRVAPPGRMPAKLVSHVVARDGADVHRHLELDVRVLDETGLVRLAVSGLIVRRATSESSAPGAALVGAPQTYCLDIAEPGRLETLQFTACTPPLLGPDDVELEVAAASLNFKDVLVALGRVPPPAPYKFGLECSGHVTRVGANVRDLCEGDAVIAFGASWFAPRARVPAAWVARLPAHLSMEEASAIPVAFTVAELAARELGRLRPGESVLVHSAAGGVGMALLRLAREAGAQIYATAGSPEKRDLLRTSGLKHVFDSRTPDFARQILEQTGGRGVDLIVNALGPALSEASLDVLAKAGRFVELGLGNDALAPLAAARGQEFLRLRLDPAAPRVARAFRRTVERFGDPRSEPLPIRVFGLGELSAAFEYMASARHVGRVVLACQNWPDCATALLRPKPPPPSGAADAVVLASEAQHIKDLVRGMSNEEGVDVFRRILQQNLPRVVVCTQDLNALLERQRVASKIGVQAYLAREALTKVAHPRPDLGLPLLAPVTDIERRLVEIWKDLLGVSEVGVKDNFFDLGGDSLIAIRVLSRCREEFEVDQTLASLFDHPTIAEFARQVVSLRQGAPAPTGSSSARERIVL